MGRPGVHVEHLERLPAPPPAAVRQLRRALRRLRWQLGLERVALFALRGLIPTSLAVAALVLASWLTATPPSALWLAAAPLAASVVFGILRWPTPLEAAIALDRRGGLDERLATAAELASNGPHGRFDGLQIRDAVAHVQRAPRAWLLFDRRTRTEAIAALLAVAVAAIAVLVVPALPRPVQPAEGRAEAPEAPTLGDSGQRIVPLDLPQSTAPAAEPPSVATPAPDLASRVQQEQSERAALDRLAQGLSNLSAGQAAADAIRQGDFANARDELQNLADNADQLSDAAKQQLARGLQQAAAATGQADRALADREQQAAQALTRSGYVDQRQALRALADQVQRSGARSVPSDQLERDVGQLQQQRSQSGEAGRTQSSGRAGASASSNASDGSGQAQGATSNGQPGGGATGQQAGPGVGTGSNPDPLSNQPSRLDSAGQTVEVPTKLGAGPGVRPADGSEDGTLSDPSLTGSTVSQLPQSQQTGRVTPEQNLVPGEQRPIVRGYFR